MCILLSVKSCAEAIFSEQSRLDWPEYLRVTEEEVQIKFGGKILKDLYWCQVYSKTKNLEGQA